MPAGIQQYWKLRLNDSGTQEKAHIAFARSVRLPVEFVGYGMDTFFQFFMPSGRFIAKLTPTIFFSISAVKGLVSNILICFHKICVCSLNLCYGEFPWKNSTLYLYFYSVYSEPVTALVCADHWCLPFPERPVGLYRTWLTMAVDLAPTP